MNILVTGIGGDIGQSILKCFVDGLPYCRLIGTDIDNYAPGRAKVDKFIQVPNAKYPQEFISSIYNAIREYDVDYICPTTEPEIDVFNQNRHLFKDNSLLILDEHILNSFLDKYNTVQHFKRYNLPYPETYLIEEYNGQLDYPFIIKARRGWGGKGMIEIHDQEEFSFYSRQVSNSIVQEILGNVDEEYTVGVFSDGITVWSIAFRRYLGYGNLSKYAELVKDDDIKDLVHRIAESCDLVGCMNVQMRRTETGYIPFEVNARISSTAYIRHHFGFEDVKWWVAIKEGKKINYKPRYKKGIGVRTIGETYYELE